MSEQRDFLTPIIDIDEILPIAPPLTPHGDVSVEEIRKSIVWDFFAEEAAERLKRKNQILLSKNSVFLQELNRLFAEAEHRATVLWALEAAEEPVAELESRYPCERRPRAALDAARAWAAGDIKMRRAQRAILDCHAVAKEIDSRADIALCHAVGQACGTVHTAGHAVGLPVYELTAVVYKYGIKDSRQYVEGKMEKYTERLLYWMKNYKEYPAKWADFMA